MAALTIQQALDTASQYHQAGRLHDAELLCQQVLARESNNARALHLLGVMAHQAGQNDLAVELIGRAIASNSSFPEAYTNLGSAQQARGRLDDAIAAHRQAIALKSDFPQAYFNLGNALKNNGQYDEAIAAYRQAIALRPEYVKPYDNLIYSLHFHPGYDAQAIAQEHRQWNKQHAGRLAESIQPHPNNRDPDRRLKIGYVSADFRDHVIGRNLLPLFREHDRHGFEITCYAQVHPPDALTAQFQERADCYRNIVGLSDEQLAGQIREDRIDILLDLTLHMTHNRLMVFARKPAPIQATFAGYPGSTGLTAIDYRLSDPYLDPADADESVYSEQTIRLPDTFWCYDPLDCSDVPVNSLPGLQAGVVTFDCLNNSLKVNEPVLDLWARVLLQVENSRLMLMGDEGTRRARTLESLGHRGIESSRVEFVPYESRRHYLEQYHGIDLGLDTFPYNGHTTSLDSLWMGVPVVTLVGQRPVSRAGWSQLSNLGLTELAAQTQDQFVQIAVNLAHDLPRLAKLRLALRGKMQQSPLMNAPKFARGIEAAYRQMWHTWCTGNEIYPRQDSNLRPPV